MVVAVFDADPSMASLKYLTVKLYPVLDDNPVFVYVVDAADNVVTNDAPLYTLICDILSVFVHDNETDVPVAVNASDVGTVVGPSKAVRRARPNPLSDPPPNVVKNGDMVYPMLVYTVNILNVWIFSFSLNYRIETLDIPTPSLSATADIISSSVQSFTNIP